jgi:predicted AlkP superfamily pyrophosphatase or phosphodiesterase
MIAPLLFSHAGMWEREQLKSTGVQPAFLYPRGRLYPELLQRGIKPFVFGMREYTPSTYSNAVMEGAELRSFKTLSEALINLGLLLQEQAGPVYVHLYFDRIDTLSHDYGPTAPQTEAEIETFLLMMEYYFERVFKGKKRVLFLMTADHGQVEVNPQTTIYLNINSQFTGVERFLKTNLKGQYLVPAGAPRDMFLYIRDELLEEAQAFLTPRLEGKADVVRTEILIEEGYFGPEVSSRFRERVANLVILPYRYESVWWYEKGKFEQKFYGHHGGLTPEEMQTVLCFYEL